MPHPNRNRVGMCSDPNGTEQGHPPEVQRNAFAKKAQHAPSPLHPCIRPMGNWSGDLTMDNWAAPKRGCSAIPSKVSSLSLPQPGSAVRATASAG
ncbi:hypothetical protein BDV11DRAFT_94831 [Aspergillus similis]